MRILPGLKIHQHLYVDKLNESVIRKLQKNKRRFIKVPYFNIQKRNSRMEKILSTLAVVSIILIAYRCGNTGFSEKILYQVNGNHYGPEVKITTLILT